MAPGRRLRGSHNAEVISIAVFAVHKKHMSIRQASKKFNIPFETLRRHVSGQAKSFNLGRPPKFDRDMESELRETVEEMMNKGRGVGLDEVKELGMELCASSGLEPFKKDKPSRGWARGFMARNNLSLKSLETAKHICETSRDSHVVDIAVESITATESPLKNPVNQRTAFLGTQGMHSDDQLEHVADCSELPFQLQPGYMKPENDEVLYIGHVVGLEEDKDHDRGLSTVQGGEGCGEVALSFETKSFGFRASEPYLRASTSTQSPNKNLKPTPTRQYRPKRDAKEIERAMHAINYENFSIRQASKHFNIPFETLRRYVIGESKTSTLTRPCKLNKKPNVVWRWKEKGNEIANSDNYGLEENEVIGNDSIDPLIQVSSIDCTANVLPKGNESLSFQEENSYDPNPEIKVEIM